jgi:hypothetical protein
MQGWQCRNSLQLAGGHEQPGKRLSLPRRVYVRRGTGGGGRFSWRPTFARLTLGHAVMIRTVSERGAVPSASRSPAMRVVCSVDEHQPADSAQRFLRGLLCEHGGGPGRSQCGDRTDAGLGGVPVSLRRVDEWARPGADRRALKFLHDGRVAGCVRAPRVGGDKPFAACYRRSTHWHPFLPRPASLKLMSHSLLSLAQPMPLGRFQRR